MVPINQVILGGDPLLGSSMVGNSLDEQLQLIEKYKQNLEAAKQLRQQVQPVQQPAQHRMIWDDIDAEINPMSDEQKSRLLQDEDYVDTYTRIQDMVQAGILSLVKGRIEATPEGKELLQRQLKIVRSLKSKIIQDTNREMEMFRKFREFSKAHPEVTPVSATPTDVYVAINSQYHDYVELFKSWFGDNVDQKIIESAIIFWFKDVDCKSRNKVVSYFKEY